jgi:hypothetical protein
MRKRMQLISKPIGGHLTLEASILEASRSFSFFLHTGDHRTLNTEKTTTMSQATIVQPALILDHQTLNIEQGATILLYRVFYKAKDNFNSLGKFIFILLQGLRKLILLMTKDRCTSLTVIGVTKIMYNNGLYKILHKPLYNKW